MQASLAILACGLRLAAADYFVAVEGTEGNPGTESAPWSLAWANVTLQPGDTAILLNGRYAGAPIAPAQSGTSGAPIIYRAANRHGAIFSRMEPLAAANGPVAIYLTDRAHIVIDGIKVVDVKRWIVGIRAAHITVANCDFQDGAGWNNCRFDHAGDGLRIVDNSFRNGTDLLSIDGGSGHLVAGNFFGDASHTGLVLLGVKRSVIRHNTLVNRRWRCMEVESQRHEPFALSEFNVIENNHFGFTPCKGIQYAGNRSIIRRNVFRHERMAMGWANYLGKVKGPEAWHNEHNRFIHNVVAECGGTAFVTAQIDQNRRSGIEAAEPIANNDRAMVFSTNLVNPKIAGYDDVGYGDNLVVNNLFYRNESGVDKLYPPSIQISFEWNAAPMHGQIVRNAIHGEGTGAKIFWLERAKSGYSIADFQRQFPAAAFENVELDPAFIEPAAGNFQLSVRSPVIDQGRALTLTTAADRGRRLPVQDALYFTDGHGLMAGDVIRVGIHRVAVVGVDYSARVLVIDRDIAWNMGEPVSLDFVGRGPDLGAYEHGTSMRVGR